MYTFFRFVILAILLYIAFMSLHLTINENEKGVRINGLIMFVGAVGAVYYICS